MKRYIFNLLISLDQFVNTLIGGAPDETLSSRFGRTRETNPFSGMVCKVLDSLDPHHCRDSIEDEHPKHGPKSRTGNDPS